MQKIKFLPLIILPILLFTACTTQTTQQNNSTVSTPTPASSAPARYAVEEFEGTITGFVSDCAFDGECAVIIDKDIRVVTVPGLVPADTPVGSSSAGENDIGKKAKVLAIKTDEKKYTLVGERTLYIKLVE